MIIFGMRFSLLKANINENHYHSKLINRHMWNKGHFQRHFFNAIASHKLNCLGQSYEEADIIILPVAWCHTFCIKSVLCYILLWFCITRFLPIFYPPPFSSYFPDYCGAAKNVQTLHGSLGTYNTNMKPITHKPCAYSMDYIAISNMLA